MERKDLTGVAVWVVGLLGVIVLLFVWMAIQKADLAREEQTRAELAQVEAEAAALSNPLPVAPPPHPVRSRNQALAAGVAFLLKQQSPDGAWRSDIYATFKDGLALTPLVVCALQAAVDAGTRDPDSTAARRKGSDYLARMVKADGTLDCGESGLDYPVYTAAQAVKALSHPENGHSIKARDAWLTYLRDRQLTEKLGWKSDDKAYGGWGYCRLIPSKPEPNAIAPPLVESNLSATVFALDALRTAGVTDWGVSEKALIFVSRCQNFVSTLGCTMSPPHLDGGFFFVYDDPVRNKAGSLESPPDKPERFHSYGSATADGFRALRLCGEADQERALVAGSWLQYHFRADTHPGNYIPAHERNREAVYYYYAASVSRAFREGHLALPDGRDWSAELTASLTKRQRVDGSWANPVELVRENDPIVATSNALTALATTTPTK